MACLCNKLFPLALFSSKQSRRDVEQGQVGLNTSGLRSMQDGM